MRTMPPPYAVVDCGGAGRDDGDSEREFDGAARLECPTRAGCTESLARSPEATEAADRFRAGVTSAALEEPENKVLGGATRTTRRRPLSRPWPTATPVEPVRTPILAAAAPIS